MEEVLPALQPAHAAQGDALDARPLMADLVARTRTYMGEVRTEMSKVTWPDWPQLKNSTFVILIFVLVVSGIIWLMDVSVRAILDVVLGLFS